MKKKLLFIVGNLESGGVSKSMVSLLNTLDRKKYDISLLVSDGTGIFMSFLPHDIQIISVEKISWLLRGVRGLFPLFRAGYPLTALGSVIRLLLSTVDKGYAGWWLSRLIPSLKDEYDTIVDYNGQHQLYYMVDKLKAKKKITFFHSDYAKWAYYYQVDKKYYSKVDYIFTISAICVQSLKKYFPDQSAKIRLMENISSPEYIKKMSLLPVTDLDVSTDPAFLTLGHVCKSKGSDLAIEAASLLKKKGVKFKWYFIGEVCDYSYYQNKINRYGLQAEINLIGLKTNPYPYIREATLYIHPSEFEGRSIALDEAKILCKPIVVTNFSTVGDQFENRVNASVCEMTPESLSFAIQELLYDMTLREKYQNYLSTYLIDNSCEVNKLYTIFDN